MATETKRLYRDYEIKLESTERIRVNNVYAVDQYDHKTAFRCANGSAVEIARKHMVYVMIGPPREEPTTQVVEP